MRAGGWISALTLLFACLAASAAAGEPRGPAFGSNRYSTTIATVAKTPDTDDYVASLIQGETLSVEVAAAADSALVPTLRFVGPAGATIDPGATQKRHGRLLTVKGFLVETTGIWTVRVGAAGATEGAYTVRFRVTPPRASRFVKQRLGGDAPLAATHAFQAVEGATLSLTIESSGRGAPVALRSLAGPAGADVALPEGAVVTKGRRVTVRDLPLPDGAGEYRVTVGIDGGDARYSLVVGVKPPPRPKGRSELAGDEPYLAARSTPLDVTTGTIVRLNGAHFPVTVPGARVWIGDAQAAVAAVGAGGVYLDVVAPGAADGLVADVTVQNPDGQAVTRASYCRYVPRRILDVDAIAPAKAVLQQGAARTFTVTLTRAAPPLGAEVALAATDGVGSLPPHVFIAGNETQANFQFVASDSPATGRIVASYLSSVTADVAVAPPAALAAISPAPAEVLEGSTYPFTLTLEGAAPPAGIDVELTAAAGIGTVPAWIHVPGGASGTTFEFTAANVRAAGKITATSANSVDTSVRVVPPAAIDVSGWRIEQANSSRTFTIPAGTMLHEGDYLVIGRSASRSQFATYWGRPLGTNVVYLDAADQWPSINGSETFQLKDADGQSVDGPTVAMTSAGGSDFQRVPGLPAMNSASWTSASASPVSNATPGAGQAAAANPPGVYVSEFSDANGTGNFVYEFVEVFFDRLP